MELERLASIFEAARVVPLRETDLLVFRANEKLSLEEHAIAHAALEQATGHSRILILDVGAELAVLRPETAPEAAGAPPPPVHRPIDKPPQPVPGSDGPKRGTAPGAIA